MSNAFNLVANGLGKRVAYILASACIAAHEGREVRAALRGMRVLDFDGANTALAVLNGSLLGQWVEDGDIIDFPGLSAEARAWRENVTAEECLAA